MYNDYSFNWLTAMTHPTLAFSCQLTTVQAVRLGFHFDITSHHIWFLSNSVLIQNLSLIISHSKVSTSAET